MWWEVQEEKEEGRGSGGGRGRDRQHCLRYRLKALPGLLHAFYGSLHDARRGDLEVTQDCDSCRLPMERKVGGTFCLGKRGDWKGGWKGHWRSWQPYSLLSTEEFVSGRTVWCSQRGQPVPGAGRLTWWFSLTLSEMTEPISLSCAEE